MKRSLTLALSVILMISLFGCAFPGAQEKAPAEFYYLRAEYVYGTSDGVVTSELREISGHEIDLRYLLSLYLQGPLDEGLRSPFPEGCTLLELQERDGTLTVTLSPALGELSDMSRTLACVCLARTCFSLTGAETVCIRFSSPDGQLQNQTIERESLLPDSAFITTDPTES